MLYGDGLRAFVFTVRLGNVPSFPPTPDDRRAENAACTCTHTGTHTLTGAALLWHVQLWQLVFFRPLTLCDDSETTGGRGGEWGWWWHWTLTGEDRGPEIVWA